MLQACTLHNFKSVYERIVLPLKPLTVFAGANSSGKSTVIQSLLLTTQTIQNPVMTRAVVLNGHILKLGEFSDVLSDGATSKTISLGFVLHVPKRAKFARSPRYFGQVLDVNHVDCEYVFSDKPVNDGGSARGLQPRLESSRLQVRAENEGQAQESTIQIRRTKDSLDERLSRFRLAGADVGVVEKSTLEFEADMPVVGHYLGGYYQPLPRTSEPAGASTQHFLPSRLSVVYDVVESQAERVIQLLTSVVSGDYYYQGRGITEQIADLPAETLTRLGRVLHNIVSEYVDGAPTRQLPFGTRPRKAGGSIESSGDVERLIGGLRSLPQKDKRLVVARVAERETEIRAAIKGERPAEFELALSPLPAPIELGVDIATQFFSRYVKYLGPLRDEPKPVYPLAGGADPKDIGYRGEHTAAVLETYRQSPVQYLPPGETQAVRRSLSYAVLDWLKYMGIAENVRTDDLGKLGHSLKVAAGAGEADHDLTHVGVGVSQVLPILVLSLLAEDGSTLIFEQPELHLHPRVQTRLADFFVSLIKVGKQCIVETHSEYLINRLRLNAVSSTDGAIAKETVLYFVERTGGRSTYRPITINEFGVIADWPKGFFDEGDEIAAEILRASSDKRRRKGKVDG